MFTMLTAYDNDVHVQGFIQENGEVSEFIEGRVQLAHAKHLTTPANSIEPRP